MRLRCGKVFGSGPPCDGSPLGSAEKEAPGVPHVVQRRSGSPTRLARTKDHPRVSEGLGHQKADRWTIKDRLQQKEKEARVSEFLKAAWIIYLESRSVREEGCREIQKEHKSKRKKKKRKKKRKVKPQDETSFEEKKKTTKKADRKVEVKWNRVTVRRRKKKRWKLWTGGGGWRPWRRMEVQISVPFTPQTSLIQLLFILKVGNVATSVKRIHCLILLFQE
jgi:hypothetical protein